MAKKIKNTNETAAEKTTEKRTPKKKMLPNVIDHCTKAGKIELQNLLFGTTEKKLLVSHEFLNSMTIKYVSRRMKTINGCFTNIANTKIPARFFRYTNEIESCLEELILLEPYYMFKDPSPSVYKKNFLLKKPELITKMLSRAWKFVLQKHPLPENIEEIDPKVMDAYDAVINDMLSYEEQLSEDDMALINKFYVQIHGKEIETEIISLTDDEFPDLGIEDMVDENDLSDDEITEAQE